MIKLIGLDLINTVIDIKKVAKDHQLQAYGDHLREFCLTGRWNPLKFPEAWKSAPPFKDSKAGLSDLQKLGYRVVTFTNAPIPFQLEWVSRNSLPFHCLTPLECYQLYKPDKYAYLILSKHYNIPLDKILVVTANYNFGDLENSIKAGMKSQYVNRDLELPKPETPRDLVELAAHLRKIDK